MTSTGGAVIIRERTDADISGAAAALVDVHATDGYPIEGVDQPEAWLTGPALMRAWVGELGGRVVGHVAISRPQSDDAATATWLNLPDGGNDNVAVLGRLFVVKAARGMAIGEKLVRTATGYAQRHGFRLVLDVMTKDASAIRLYERLGWRKIGEAQHDNGKGQLVPAICLVGPDPL